MESFDEWEDAKGKMRNLEATCHVTLMKVVEEAIEATLHKKVIDAGRRANFDTESCGGTAVHGSGSNGHSTSCIM